MKGPLTGRPGTAALVAGVLNMIASGPNQSQMINTKDFTGRVSRGSGRDVRADGKVKDVPLPVGDRTLSCARLFMQDLKERLANRVQITSDGHRAYVEAVEGAFGDDVDFAQLVKIYGPAPTPAGRYSPADCLGAKKRTVTGNPDEAHVSTSYVERANLTIRMGNRRFTRLTNAFSKKIDNHLHALALFFLHYNFVRIHKSLKVTPAMAAGVSETLWTVERIAEEIEERRPAAGKRGPYKKRVAKAI